MTQNEKDLLLKDLCARLPYRVKVQSYNYEDDIETVETLYNIDSDRCMSTLECDTLKNITKPYLFPLSSMTNKQLKEMQEIIGNSNEACISVNTYGLELWLNSVDTDPTIWLDTIFELQDWLNKNHFDYRGLIPTGLAIDATNLNIY